MYYFDQIPMLEVHRAKKRQCGSSKMMEQGLWREKSAMFLLFTRSSMKFSSTQLTITKEIEG